MDIISKNLMPYKLAEKFIPYRLALKLKELGFNDKTLGTYIFNGKKLTWELTFIISDNKYPHLIAAPTWQDAFEWFRYNYKIDSCIKELYKDTKKVGYWVSIDQYQGITYNNYTDYNILYEDARLFCLNKLIELFTNK